MEKKKSEHIKIKYYNINFNILDYNFNVFIRTYNDLIIFTYSPKLNDDDLSFFIHTDMLLGVNIINLQKSAKVSEITASDFIKIINKYFHYNIEDIQKLNIEDFADFIGKNYLYSELVNTLMIHYLNKNNYEISDAIIDEKQNEYETKDYKELVNILLDEFESNIPNVICALEEHKKKVKLFLDACID